MTPLPTHAPESSLAGGDLELASARLAREEWQLISTAPKDTPVLAFYDHKADPYHDGETGKLTDYGAVAEGGEYLPGKGIAIVKWADPSWEDEGWESFTGGYWLPGGWFLYEDGEHRDVVCNATHWMSLPEPPLADLPDSSTNEAPR